MKYPTGVCIITHTSAMGLVVLVLVWQLISKNIIQHPYWGKIFPFQYDYAYKFY